MRSWTRRDKPSNDGLVKSSHNYKSSTTSRLLKSLMRKPGTPSRRPSYPKPSEALAASRRPGPSITPQHPPRVLNPHFISDAGARQPAFLNTEIPASDLAWGVRPMGGRP